MPLLSLWTSNADAVGQMSIEQIVSSAGDGNLKDQSFCCTELRQYLGEVPTSKIGTYIEHCLANVFPRNGMVLQDLINELGRRLDYDVTNGRYQGVTNAIGFDGLWRSPERHTIIAEVKTTDAYRLSLDTLARYRTKLIESGEASEASSILIVVGRQDTGELEAQIRGSRHAWDVRVISAEALIKLVLLKENSDAEATGLKIRSLLMPVEYTRLDKMVDVMFTTATDQEISQPIDEQVAIAYETQDATTQSDTAGSKGTWQFTDASLLQAKRESIVAALSKREHTPLVKKSRALFWSAQHNVRVACSISKLYTAKNTVPYWYAYHPAWDEFLSQSDRSFFVLGCMDRNEAYAIPHAYMAALLSSLNTTTTKDGSAYWHVHVTERGRGLEIMLPKNGNTFPLASYTLTV